MGVRAELRREMARARGLIVDRAPALPEITDEEAAAWYEAELGPYYAAEEARMRALCPSLFRDRAEAPTPEASAMSAPAAAPRPDPLAAADEALRRRLATEAPLPSETVRLFYGSFVAELTRVAPGAAWRLPGVRDEDRAAWAAAFPAVADRLDELWRHDPHSDRFYACLYDLCEWLRQLPDHSSSPIA